MATIATTMNERELTPQQFAKARKQTMLFGACDMWYYQEASPQQLHVLHQIELTVKSITIQDLEDY